MTPEQARKILEKHFNKQLIYRHNINLPINDCIVHGKFDDKGIEEYTFKYLLKIAYNLQDK